MIRDAISRFTAAVERRRPTIPLFDTLGNPGLAERVEEELARGFGRD